MFSGHDTNIIQLSMSLKLSDFNCIRDKYHNKTDKFCIEKFPTYATSMHFELY
jgi:hypothetical protein